MSESKPSHIWYLVPILLGIIGGLVMYLVLKDENENMARKGLKVGIVITIADIIIPVIMFAIRF